MKTDNERTNCNIQDLGDQAKGLYILIFTVPSAFVGEGALRMAMYVDEVQHTDTLILGFRDGQDKPVVAFPKGYAWYAVKAEYMETLRMEDYVEVERRNIEQRVQTKKSYEAVFNAAVQGNYQGTLDVTPWPTGGDDDDR